MAIQEEKKTDAQDALTDNFGEQTDLVRPSSEPLEPNTSGEGPDGQGQAGEGDDEDEVPVQIGHHRFVYAAYFAAAILVAFVAEKTLTFAWVNLAKWKPNFGEPSDEVVMPIAGVLGALVALYYWKSTRTRELAEDVASELAKVTWPTRKEVVNNTMVVIFTTTFATVFFTLMDRFWSFVTNWVYGT